MLRGTARRDVIAALGGNDVVRGAGRSRPDLPRAQGPTAASAARAPTAILGQLGADRLEGGLGRDRLEGGPGRDLLLGGAGIDRLLGLGGRDTAPRRPRRRRLPGRGAPRLLSQASVRGAPLD